MKEIFTVKNCNKTVRQQHKNNLEIKVTKSATFGTKSLTSLGPKVGNSLPAHLKLCECLPFFKKMIGMVLNTCAINAKKNLNR